MTHVGLTGNVDQLSDCIRYVYGTELLNGKGEADWNRSQLMASEPSESVQGVQRQEMGNYQIAELQIGRDKDGKYSVGYEYYPLMYKFTIIHDKFVHIHIQD